MRLFTFLNGGTDIPAYIQDNFVYIELDKCSSEDNAGAVNRYLTAYRFIHSDSDPAAYVNGYEQETDISFAVIPECEYDKVNFEIKGDVTRLLKGNSARRPGYQIRGAKVTEEQAFEVIANSDEIFTTQLYNLLLMRGTNGKSVPKWFHDVQQAVATHRIITTPYGHISNKFLQESDHLWYSGFVTPAGDVGCNYWTYKYPEFYELFLDALVIGMRFPFLEFVVAVTYWDERSPGWYASSEEKRQFYDANIELNEWLQCCLYVHNGTIEVQNTLDKYRELEDQYSDKHVFEIEEYYRSLCKSAMPCTFVDKMLKYHALDSSAKFCKYVHDCHLAHHLTYVRRY